MARQKPLGANPHVPRKRSQGPRAQRPAQRPNATQTPASPLASTILPYAHGGSRHRHQLDAAARGGRGPATGTVKELHRESQVTRLGDKVDAGGRLSDEAIGARVRHARPTTAPRSTATRARRTSPCSPQRCATRQRRRVHRARALAVRPRRARAVRRRRGPADVPRRDERPRRPPRRADGGDRHRRGFDRVHRGCRPHRFLPRVGAGGCVAHERAPHPQRPALPDGAAGSGGRHARDLPRRPARASSAKR